MTETAESAVDTAHRLLALFREAADRLRDLGRAAVNALRVFDALRERPLATVNALAERTGASYPTVARAVDALEGLGIVRESTGRKRERVFVCTRDEARALVRYLRRVDGLSRTIVPLTKNDWTMMC